MKYNETRIGINNTTTFKCARAFLFIKTQQTFNV